MISIDCSVGEGGGGILRAILPVSLLLNTPIHFKKFRAGRTEQGIGWPHKWLIDSICLWTNSYASPINLGTTDFIFKPGKLNFDQALVLNYDDSDITLVNSEITVRREYDKASDQFQVPMNNLNGKSVRGHSIATPLIALLPLVSATQHYTEIKLLGGTETPGAPFIDALDSLFVPVLNNMGANLSLTVTSRGCIGIGGGETNVTAKPSLGLKPFKFQPVSSDSTKTSIDAKLYVYGTYDYFEKITQSYEKLITFLSNRLEHKIDVTPIFVPYPFKRYQQLFIIRNGDVSRDISICYEELTGDQKHTFGLPLVLERVKNELKHSHLMSRFLVDYLIPLASTVPGKSEFFTERITGHALSVIASVTKVTGREIKVEYIAPDIVKITI